MKLKNFNTQIVSVLLVCLSFLLLTSCASFPFTDKIKDYSMTVESIEGYNINNDNIYIEGSKSSFKLSCNDYKDLCSFIKITDKLKLDFEASNLLLNEKGNITGEIKFTIKNDLYNTLSSAYEQDITPPREKFKRENLQKYIKLNLIGKYDDQDIDFGAPYYRIWKKFSFEIKKISYKEKIKKLDNPVKVDIKVNDSHTQKIGDNIVRPFAYIADYAIFPFYLTQMLLSFKYSI
ncbi:hypothetical protein L4D04_22145 [Photobacterium angustum]|uniref:hypothetical protein n=1 Tax=Photobacterium angustum TaxID=661 RepID=UPI003D0C46F1